jgi:Family of unknown function (DUF6516)
MKNVGISTLLDLHQQVIDQEDGYWVKIEAWQVEVTTAIPHGVRYSLTLHDPQGLRIMGYDNAHALKTRSGYAGRKLPYDHKHRSSHDQGVHYAFKDAYQLLGDFFLDVDRALKAAKGK